MSYPIEQIRSQFPILQQQVNDKPLVYLDSGATAQKPLQVLNRIDEFYRQQNAAVHRGVHQLSSEATTMMEQVRDKVQVFIGAKQRDEIVFVRGATQAINLVASSFGGSHWQAGDEIIITEMEHHANIVPWQLLAERLELTLVIWPIEADGRLATATLQWLLTQRTRLLAVTHVSNVLGTVNPIAEIVKLCRDNQTLTLIDGAQAVMHHRVDVQALDCDFYLFSGHKLYAPTGSGILYGKLALLESMPPMEGGGAMITEVDLVTGSKFAKPPYRFEAGTPNTCAIIGLGSAIDYIEQVGLDNIAEYEQGLMAYALMQLGSVDLLKIYGEMPLSERAGVIAFNLDGIHALDVGTFLDRYGIAIRTGHHCAMPLLKHYQQSSMCRLSIAMYNDKSEIDALVAGLTRIVRLLGK